MQRAEVIAGITVLIVLALTGICVWCIVNQPTKASVSPEPVVIAMPPMEPAALIYVADSQGYFTANDLNVTIVSCGNAMTGISSMENGSADIAVSSEYPVVTEIMKGGNVRVIGCIDKYQTQFLVGRKDSNITNVTDLAGKKIAVHLGGSEEFYLGRFLSLHGISLRNVTLVNIAPPQSVQALANGTVDAAQLMQTNLAAAQSMLGDNEVTWPAQNGQSAFILMTGRDSWVSGHPEIVSGLLTALDQAEEFVVDHPAEAETILQQRMNYTDAYAASIWPQHEYTLSLDQSLVTAMEDEGRWVIANNQTGLAAIPDFSGYIDTRGLEDVKPAAVDINS